MTAGTEATTPVPTGAAPLVEGVGIVKRFAVKGKLLGRTRDHVYAVAGIDIEIPAGTTVAVVGESGSGKTTLARCLLRLIEPSEGTILAEGEDITHARGAALSRFRRLAQMVFQDPYASFDPLLPVKNSLNEPLVLHTDLSRAERADRISELMTMVGLRPSTIDRYPRQFSGGQLQRIAIARALATEPKFIVLDEPVSSLDVSIRADVINLLAELQQKLALGFMFITHDLALMRHSGTRVAVMYLGKIVEEGPAATVYDTPRHPYTQALLSAIPEAHPERQRQRNRIVLAGDPPSPFNPPSGCPFHTRCMYAMDICSTEEPPVTELPDGGRVTCHLHQVGLELGGAPLPERVVTVPNGASSTI